MGQVFPPRFRVGDRVVVDLFGSQRIAATICQVEDEIKNGRAGYVLEQCSDGLEHWCYDDQIMQVLG